jgi:hypothetical protein
VRIFWVKPSGRYLRVFEIFSSNESFWGLIEAGADREYPHSMQNLLLLGLRVRQFGQGISKRAPHSLQNFVLSRFWKPQSKHFIPEPSGIQKLDSPQAVARIK